LATQASSFALDARLLIEAERIFPRARPAIEAMISDIDAQKHNSLKSSHKPIKQAKIVRRSTKRLVLNLGEIGS
jgi:hypothetical protein